MRQGSRRAGARAIVAHVDTLGAQVKAIKDNGRLELVPIGHWSARFAEGARVTIYGTGGIHRGTILPLKASGHTFNEEVDTLPVGWSYVEVRIDARTRTPDETLKLGIEVGDIVAIDTGSEFLENGFINSRHLDDKAGVALRWQPSRRWSGREQARLLIRIGFSPSRKKSALVPPPSLRQRLPPC